MRVSRGLLRRLVGMATMLALGLSACGGSEDEVTDSTAPVVGQGIPRQVDHPVADAIDGLQRAFLAGDYEAICAASTATAARHAGIAGHGEVTQCVRDVRRLFVMVQKIDGWRHIGMPRVIDVEVDDADAVATVALDRRWQAQVPMSRENGRWMLSGMFGTPPPGARAAARAIERAEFPAKSGASVRVSDDSGGACTALSEDRYPRISGGCQMRLRSGVTPFTILTVFGDFELDRCSIDYSVSVDAQGRTWTEDFEVGGDNRSVACGDVNACYDYALEWLVPWRGRLYPAGDGTYLHRMDMCLRTCVGYFIGQLVVRLIPDEDGWRAEPVDGGGHSGFRFDAPLRVRADVELATG